MNNEVLYDSSNMDRLIAHIIVGAAILLCVNPHPGLGRQKRSLTIEEAIATGLENSRVVQSSLMRVQAADAKSREVSTSVLPTVKFGGGYVRLSDVPPSEIIIPRDLFGPEFPPQTVTSTLSPVVLDQYNLRLSLQQPLFTGFRLSSSVEAARYTADATGEDYQKDRSNLVYEIQAAYWSLHKLVELKKVVDQNVEQVQAHLTDVQNMLDQGMATRNEVLKVEVNLSQARLTQIEAGNNIRLAMLALNNVIGIPLQTEVELASRVEPGRMNIGELQTRIEEALQNRPELRAAEFRVRAAEAGVSVARSNLFPQISLLGNYYYSRPNLRVFPIRDEFRGTWDIGLTVSLDVWNWGSAIHQTTEAQAQLELLKNALAQTRDAITLDVTQSYLDANQSRERIAVAEAGVAHAEENYRITRERFRSDLALSSELLDAEVALLQARWNRIQALVDHELAKGRLRRAIGAAVSP